MNILSGLKVIALAGLVGAFPVAFASAAEPAGTKDHQHHMDHQFAHCLILDNDNEIEMAKIAERKSQNKDVQKFAQTMESDHAKFVKDLERFAGSHVRRM